MLALLCHFYHFYDPYICFFVQLDDVLRSGDVFPYQVYKGCLRMDGQTLMNLEIFSNNADGGASGKFLPISLRISCYNTESPYFMQ